MSLLLKTWPEESRAGSGKLNSDFTSFQLCSLCFMDRPSFNKHLCKRFLEIQRGRMHCSSSQGGLLWGVSTSKPEFVKQCGEYKDLSIYLEYRGGNSSSVQREARGGGVGGRGAPTGTWEPSQNRYLDRTRAKFRIRSTWGNYAVRVRGCKNY